MTQIAVPVPRPSVPTQEPDGYVGLHRAPELPPRPVGEGTRERRPYTLAEADGPTRRIGVTAGFFGFARAVWQYGSRP